MVLKVNLDGALKMLWSAGFFKPRNCWASDQEGNKRERLVEDLVNWRGIRKQAGKLANLFDLNKAVRRGKNHQWAVTWSVLHLSFSSEIQANFKQLCFLAGHKAEYGSPARSISVVRAWPGASLLNLFPRLQASDLSSAISHHFSRSEIYFGCDLACGITFNWVPKTRGRPCLGIVWENSLYSGLPVSINCEVQSSWIP